MLDRLKKRTGETDENILLDCMESAKAAIQSRRYPFGDAPEELEARYNDLQYRCALDLYNKIGAEGQTAHDENGISRVYESSWISDQLLSEVVPFCGVSK
jgi:hypothetical protein